MIFLILFISFISGWLGLYVYRTLVEVRNRPLYYLNDYINLSPEQKTKLSEKDDEMFIKKVNLYLKLNENLKQKEIVTEIENQNN